MDTIHTFIFMGPQGSGKGTQRDLLEKYVSQNIDQPYLSFNTGQSFRDFFAAGDGVVQRNIKETINAGGLLPDFLPNYMFAKEIINNFTGSEHLFLDGYPRSLGQAQNLDSVLHFFSLSKVFVIMINVEESTSVQRMQSRGREDDTQDSIKRRLQEYQRDTLPVMDYFKQNKNYEILEIDGERGIVDIHQDIVSKIFKN